MFELCPIPHDSIPAALDKAQHYRLLNEPAEAESICRDILALEPDHPRALITLLLALSDQLEESPGDFDDARALLPRLADDYARSYYSGILWERRAKATLRRGGPGAGQRAYTFFYQALEAFGRARQLAPAGNPDAILRWNTCVRLVEGRSDIVPAHEDRTHPLLE